MNSRNRRALVIGLGIIVAALFILRTVPTITGTVSGWRTRVEANTGLIAALERELLTRHLLADSLSRLEGAAAAIPSHLLGARTEPDARVLLRRRVTGIAASVTVVLDSIVPDSLVHVPDGDLAAVHSTAHVRADLVGATRLLQGLESDPVVWIESAELESRNPGQPGLPEEVGVRIRVAAWMVIPS